MKFERNSGFPPPHLRYWQHKVERFQVRAMIVIEGYVVLRRPGCMPFLLSIREFSERFEIPKTGVTQ